MKLLLRGRVYTVRRTTTNTLRGVWRGGNTKGYVKGVEGEMKEGRIFQLCLGVEGNVGMGLIGMASIGGVGSDMLSLYPPLAFYPSRVSVGAILITPLV